MILKILKRIRLFRKKESYSYFYDILGFVPKNILLYEEALRHRSSSKKDEAGKYINNERLEFLGDAVLSSIIADIVFSRYSNKKEGFLTNTRSKIVKRESLDNIASKLGLAQVLVSSSRTQTQKSHILGNALEALIGAIYLDKGYDKTSEFVKKKIVDKHLNIDDLAKKELNFKSKLLEWCQKNKIALTFDFFEDVSEKEKLPIFVTIAYLNSIEAGTGTGFSKKEAQQNASEESLKKIKGKPKWLKKILNP
ncbi:RNase III [Bacteroidales bacterium]|nr:RNase III [Bacteroidales bacterium]